MIFNFIGTIVALMIANFITIALIVWAVSRTMKNGIEDDIEKIKNEIFKALNIPTVPPPAPP